MTLLIRPWGFPSIYKDRLRFLKITLRQLELDQAVNGHRFNDNPNIYPAKCTAILTLIAEVKKKTSSHQIKMGCNTRRRSDNKFRSMLIRCYIKRYTDYVLAFAHLDSFR